MSGVWDMINLYQFSERVKGYLIAALKLVDAVSGFRGDLRRGAARATSMYLEIIAGEARIAANSTRDKRFLTISSMIQEASNLVGSGMHEQARRVLSEALSLTTTACAEGYEKLSQLNIR